MNKIIYTLVICLTMTNEFAVCATRGGVVIHDLVDARLEEINRKYSVHGDRPDGSLDRDYAITLLVEMADVLRVAYGKPGRDFTKLVENMQEIQRFRARYPGCEELQKVCDQLQGDEAKEMISIIRRYQVSRRAYPG